MKNLLLALRTLPRKFIKDDTRITDFREDVFVAHPSYPPMIWEASTKEWKELRLYHIDLNKPIRKDRTDGTKREIKKSNKSRASQKI